MSQKHRGLLSSETWLPFAKATDCPDPSPHLSSGCWHSVASCTMPTTSFLSQICCSRRAFIDSLLLSVRLVESKSFSVLSKKGIPECDVIVFPLAYVLEIGIPRSIIFSSQIKCVSCLFFSLRLTPSTMIKMVSSMRFLRGGSSCQELIVQ